MRKSSSISLRKRILTVWRPVLIDIDPWLRVRYCFVMSVEKRTGEAMALPLSERVSLAQALWESTDEGLPDADERASIAEAIRRDEELSKDDVAGRTHEEVIQAARCSLE